MCERGVEVGVDDGVELRVERLDAPDGGLDQFARGDLGVGDQVELGGDV
jgi:hypothetical protein